MEDDLIEIIESKHGVIKENGSRVEQLFGVHVDVKKTNGGKWTCELSPETGASPEGLVKAKIYIHSLLCEGDDFSTLVVTYDARLHKMILKTRDDIERETAVVISPGDHDNDIKLQGPLDKIIITKTIIENLIRQQQSHAVHNGQEVNNDSSSPYLHIQSSHTSEQDSLQRDYLPKVPFPIRSNVDLSQYSISQSNSDGAVYFGKDSDEYSQDFDYHGLLVHALDSRLQMSSPSHDSSSDSSDDEDIVLEIQNNPDYQSKIQFALKLGYKEADLLRALKKLGLDAGQNELLSELIKHGISEGETGISDRLVFVDESSFGLTEDITELASEPGNKNKDVSDNLRHIIVDGSNIAMSHGNKEMFSCHGIKLAVDWFRERGHKDITVFVPQWRKETSRSDSKIKDQAILSQLEKEKVLVYTPARRIAGKRVVCYDDRYILKLAVDTDGIVVSNDNYRDLLDEKEEFKKVIEERLLMYSFVNDRFMPPDDPLGRNGPTLEAFLQKKSSLPKSLPPLCPYGSKKCTYGNKCKFYHPERRNTPQKSVTEKLAEQAKQRMMEVKERNDVKKPLARTSLCRTKSLNPGEIGKRSDESRLTSTLSGSATSLNTQDDDTYHLFNQKLSENLRKMAKEKDSQDPQPKTPEKKVKKKNKETLNQSSPRLTFRPGGASPSGVSPRGTSPVGNLIVPGNELDFDDSEKFLSGHLLLAKKLSDEANESDKNRKAGKQLKESSLASGQSTGLSYHFSEIPTASKPEPKKTKQKLHRPPQKQALSRQLSLQGTEDPRLRQGHSAIKQQYSYGGTSQLVKNMPNPTEIKSLMSDFMKGQNKSAVENQSMYGDVDRSNNPQSASHGIKPALTRMPSDGFTPSFTNDFPFNLSMTSHTPVTRMQSAPDPHTLQQQHVRSNPRMTRQNSSSDTQLNKLDSLDESSALISGRQFYPDPFVDSLYTRGTISGTNTGGPVAFQFAGHPTGLPHGRPMGLNSQNLQQFSNIHNVQQFKNTQNVPQFKNTQNVQQFIHPRDMSYHYQSNPQGFDQQLNQQGYDQQLNQQGYDQQLSQQGFEAQQQLQHQMSYRNMNNSSGSFGVSTYPGMSQNQSMFGPPQASGVGRSHSGSHSRQPGHTNMPGLGLPSRHGQVGAQNYGPGPPHLLDQQTSRIWGNNGPFLPMGGSFLGNEQTDQSSALQIPSTNIPFQHQQLRSSPTPSNTDSMSENDPRYELYCNLCKLFPEEKVRSVMRLHPDLDNPNEICAYLIGAR